MRHVLRSGCVICPAKIWVWSVDYDTLDRWTHGIVCSDMFGAIELCGLIGWEHDWEQYVEIDGGATSEKSPHIHVFDECHVMCISHIVSNIDNPE